MILYFGLSGLLIRASGILLDYRLFGYEAYYVLSFNSYVSFVSDCLDRYLCRFNEFIESSRIIYLCLFNVLALSTNTTSSFPSTTSCSLSDLPSSSTTSSSSFSTTSSTTSPACLFNVLLSSASNIIYSNSSAITSATSSLPFPNSNNIIYSNLRNNNHTSLPSTSCHRACQPTSTTSSFPSNLSNTLRSSNSLPSISNLHATLPSTSLPFNSNHINPNYAITTNLLPEIFRANYSINSPTNAYSNYSGMQTTTSSTSPALSNTNSNYSGINSLRFSKHLLPEI